MKKHGDKCRAHGLLLGVCCKAEIVALQGKILPGLNAIQINSQVGQILATQIQAEAQQKYTNAVADTQV